MNETIEIGVFLFTLLLRCSSQSKAMSKKASEVNMNKVEIERDNDNIINVIASTNSSGH